MQNIDRIASPLTIGLIPVTLGLYDRLNPQLRTTLQDHIEQVVANLNKDNLKILCTPVLCSDEKMRQSCRDFARQKVDLLVVSHLSYSPSGQISPALLDSQLPLLLWPIQQLEEIVPDQYSRQTISENHGIHGTMDLANVLNRRGKNFGILHGHWTDKAVQQCLVTWAQAGRILKSMKMSNPIVLGERFQDMLDLHLENEEFIQELSVRSRPIPLAEFSSISKRITQTEIETRVIEYREQFAINESLSEPLLQKTVRHELALRRLLTEYNSFAFGINFVDLCNHSEIGDALHVPASILMAEGLGYGGEGDWETAMFLYGLQTAFGLAQASFTEIFSVGYKDQRFVLRHWGEGNIALSREQPKLICSAFNDSRKVEFAICDFEFSPGRATLINLSATPNSKGQIITISGNISKDRLPAATGVRAIFKPDTNDIAQLLNDYSTLGGSHHMVIVKGSCAETLDRLAKLAGWESYQLPQANQ